MKSTNYLNINNQLNPNLSQKYFLNFINWFVGFTDGEGCFQIINNKTKKTVTFSFVINLHLDDKNTLEYIQQNLGVGKIKSRNTSVKFEITDYNSIKNILIPIFEHYSLCTIKQLNFLKFKEAFLYKHHNKKLSNADYNCILNIKSKMNRGLDYNSNEVINFYNDRILNLSAYWLLGFIEAEGTFGVKNLSMYFQICQHSVSVGLLKSIKKFIENIPITQYDLPLIRLKPNITMALNKKTNVYSYVISDIDVLFYVILPFLNCLEFKSRKFIDFKLWSISLLLRKYGYFYLAEGRSLLVGITKCINKKRYSTNKTKCTYISEKDVDLVFNQKPPFDLNLGQPHLINTQTFSRLRGANKGFKVYVYDNNILIKGSFFNSYSSTQRHLNIKSNRTIARYIDTGNIYKDRYSFYSKLQKRE